MSLQAEEGERGPEEIYYDLTQFDWYRRGEPLIAEERSYRPAGKPEATMGRRFEKAGEYEGVSYYEQEGAESPADTVYVPVFPDYWLPFAASAMPE